MFSLPTIDELRSEDDGRNYWNRHGYKFIGWSTISGEQPVEYVDGTEMSLLSNI